MDAMIAVEHLTKRYKKAATPGRGRHQLRGRPRRAVRVPRPERGGQDHHDLHPDHHAGQDERHGHDRRPRPRSRGDRRPARDRDHLPEPEHRQPPVGRGEHPAPRRALRRVRLPAVLPDHAGRVSRPDRAPGAGRRARRRPLPPAQDVLGRHEAQARDRPQPDASTARCSSSTSRRPASTRSAAAACGTTCARSATTDGTTDLPDHPLPRRSRGGRSRVRDRPRQGRGRSPRPTSSRADCSSERSCSTPSTGRPFARS